MAVGYAYNGQCYSSTSEANLAFQKDFTQYDGTHVNTLNSSTVSATGVVTYSITSRSLDSAVAPVTRTGTFTLRQCDYSFVQTKDIPDMALAGLLFFAAFLGFLSGYRP